AELNSGWTVRDASGQMLRRLAKQGTTWTWLEDYVYRDGTLMAAELPGTPTRLQFHLDHLGTPRLITADDGVEIARHTYYPFGGEATSPAQDNEPRKFTGHERDGHSLDYMHARYYTAEWGRFLSVDPGPSDLRRPQTWNRYVYAENNPVNRNDPDGRLTNPVTQEVGKGKPILHRGGGVGEIRELRSSVTASAGGEYGAARSGGRPHKGVDIVAPVGTPLVAAFSGTAEVRPEFDKDGKQNKLGLTVVVFGKDGTTAMYAHLSGTDVKTGDKIKEGQEVGDAGRSGNVMKAQPANEDHVHFQLYHKNKLTDPEEFLNDPEKQKQFSDGKPKQ
ncbi:MAG TPA: peptidoglycan DD-metalloendopeptidase family protein, partial [Thermoanaerobaculia bacterium]|nr:peptidoglycan DD-metalloendopeptidase family protein [Thermoanaerobaculia bacterium]